MITNLQQPLQAFLIISLRTNPIKNFVGTLISVDIDIKSLGPKDETILSDFPF
jgi:hypothetical protein